MIYAVLSHWRVLNSHWPHCRLPKLSFSIWCFCNPLLTLTLFMEAFLQSYSDPPLNSGIPLSADPLPPHLHQAHPVPELLKQYPPPPIYSSIKSNSLNSFREKMKFLPWRGLTRSGKKNPSSWLLSFHRHHRTLRGQGKHTWSVRSQASLLRISTL